MALTKLTTKSITGDTLEAGDLAANSVDSSELVDNAVTLAKMASGTDGNIISYDASGNPVAIATGNDGQVLTSAGAGQPPAFESVSAGTALTGSTNNTITTVTGANAIQGEANLTFDGTNLTLGTGNLIIGTNGKGIDFAITPDESGGGSAATSEVLDEYEEGTWTMDFQDASGNQATYHNNTGYYTKIGDRVFINGFINVNSIGSVSGNAKLVTLPFTVKNNNAAYSSAHVGYCTGGSFGTAGHNVSFHIKPNDTQLEPRLWDATTGNSVLQGSEISSGCGMMINGQYVAA